MKLFRYRRPSFRRLTGITTLKRRVRHDLGISEVQAITNKSRIRQRILQKAGYYSPAMRAIRNAQRGRYPTLLGLFRHRK